MKTPEQMAIPILHHPFCRNANCKVCLKDHLDLGAYLDTLIYNKKEDTLSSIHGFIGRNTACNFMSETEYGWAHPQTFSENTIKLWANWYNETGADRARAELWRMDKQERINLLTSKLDSLEKELNLTRLYLSAEQEEVDNG